MTRAKTPKNVKKCNKCGEDFNAGNQKARQCNQCRMDKFKTAEGYESYRLKQIEASRKYKFKRYYKITEEQFYEMLEVQDNKCAICFIHNDELKVRMNIDHDHGCCPGKETCGNCVRGLICGSCNMALGAFKDNKVLLQRAIEYVERFGG
jgi:hypothetical protein